MSVMRRNCIVLDTSVLPKRPSIGDIKQFLDCELKVDMTLVKSVQTHNVKNVVYMSMHNEEEAVRIASNHHLKHHMECGGKRFHIPLPIYIDSSAVDVRLHDLPEEIENVTIIDNMKQYGEVISIRNDVWRSYFPGLSNGVRVLRMKLSKPIPSYITICQETTYVSYFSQIRTCRNCGGKEHPKLRCSEAAASTANERPNKTPNVHHNSSPLPDKQWPSLSNAEPSGTKSKKQANNKQEPKRTRSIDSDTTSNHVSKRIAPPLSVSSESDSSAALSDVPSAAARGYRRNSYSHIDDLDLRQQYIEEDDQRIAELKRQGYTI